MTGRVNNITYVIPPGPDGVILEDQVFTVEQICDALKNDFNFVSAHKVVLNVEEIPEEVPVVEEVLEAPEPDSTDSTDKEDPEDE